MPESHWKTQLAPFLENFLEVVLVVDLDSGTVLESNGTARATLGYSRRDLRGLPFATLFPHNDSRGPKSFVDEVRAHGSVLSHKFLNSAGEDHWMNLRITLIPWQGSVSMLVTLSDAEQRVPAQLSRENRLDFLEKATLQAQDSTEFVPICMDCRRIQSGSDTWFTVEDYLHQDAKFRLSHGICPDCYNGHCSANTCQAS